MFLLLSWFSFSTVHEEPDHPRKFGHIVSNFVLRGIENRRALANSRNEKLHSGGALTTLHDGTLLHHDGHVLRSEIVDGFVRTPIDEE